MGQLIAVKQIYTKTIPNS